MIAALRPRTEQEALLAVILVVIAASGLCAGLLAVFANGPLALVVPDPEGGYEVVDTRDGLSVAWRFQLSEAAAVASRLNASYPPGAPAPAHDSLVFEVAMERIAGEPVLPLAEVDRRGMIPDAIDDRPALWKP